MTQEASRWGVRLTVLGVLALVVLGALLVPWDWRPGGGEIPLRSAADYFDARTLAADVAFDTTQERLALSVTGLQLVLALALGLTRPAARVIGRLPGPWWAQAPIAVAALSVIGWVVVLPLRVLLRRNSLEVGLSTGPWSAWLRDQAVSLAIGWVATSVLVLVVLGAARLLPRVWPLVVAGLSAGLVAVTSFAWPLLVEPLFNDFEPLPDGALRSAVERIARAEGVPVDDVLVADASRRTSAFNAYVSGLGSTRRVVFYDTTVEDLPTAQAESIAAHELAHARHHDVALGTGLGALGAVVGVGALAVVLGRRRLLDRVGAKGPGDPRIVPLLLALVAVGGLVSAPVQNVVSRAMEARADRTAIEFTAGPDDAGIDAFIAMQQSLAERAHRDPDPARLPHLWFGTHPTTMERISLAEALREGAR